jgi:hypothetical protein
MISQQVIVFKHIKAMGVKHMSMLLTLFYFMSFTFVGNLNAQFTKVAQNISGTPITTITPNTSFKYHIQINCASLTVSCGSATFTDVLDGNLTYIGNSATAAGLVASYNSVSRTVTVTGLSDGSTYDFDIIVGIGNLYNGTVIPNSATITDGTNVRTTPLVNVTVTGGQNSPGFWNGINGWKTASPQGAPNNIVSYNMTIGNPSAYTYSNFVFEDIFPNDFLMTDIGTPVWTGTNINYTIQYRNASGIWVNWFTANSGVYEWRVIGELGLSAGDVKGIRLTFATMPGGGSFTDNNQQLTLLGRVRSTATLGSLMINCGNYSATNTSNGAVYNQQYCDTTAILSIVNPIISGKIRTPELPGYLPGDTIPFTLYFGLSEYGSSNFVNPEVIDILPPELEFVQTVSIEDESDDFYATSGPFAPTFTQEAISGGRTRLKWVFTGMTIPKDWNVFKINIKTRIKPGVATGIYTNHQYVNSATNSATYCTQYSPWTELPTITDTGDLDGDGNTTEKFCSSSNNFTVIFPSGAGLETFKWVKGTLDAAYNRYPLTGSTVRGGLSDYKLVIKNPGTVPMTQIKVIDILPFVGDKGVVVYGTDRLSQWRPYLVGAVTAPAGATVSYSTVSNPCRTELGLTVAGCTAPSWSTTPPTDITTVRSIKFDLGTITINPNDSVVLSWPMRAPTTAPTGGDIAWNSFGYVATRTDNSTVLLASEPRKVGISVQPGSPADFGDRVWLDVNANGIQDAAETTGVSGIKVELYQDNGNNIAETSDTYIGFTMTDSDGSYLFPNLPAGNYFAVFSGLSVGQSVSPANANGNNSDALDSDGTPFGAGKWATTVTNLTALEVGRTWDLGLYTSITCPTPATVDAGSDQTLCTNVFTMAATTPSVGIGTWSVVSGTATIADIYSPTTSVTLTSSDARLIWTVSAGTCTDRFKNVDLEVLAATTITTHPTGFSICQGQAGSALSIAASGSSLNYQWQISTDNISFGNILGQTGTSYTPSVSSVGTTYYRAAITNSCGTIHTNSATVTVRTPASVTASNVAACMGGTIQLNATATPVGGTFSWTGVGGFSAATQNTTRNSVTTAMSGTYTVLYTAPNGCTDNDNTVVTIMADPTVNITGTNTICIGGSTTLTAAVSGGSGTTSYQWQQNISGTWTNVGTNSITYATSALTATTDFRVVITQSDNGCGVTSSAYTITVMPDPSVSFTGNNTVCSGGTTTLTANITDGFGTTTYQWQQNIAGTWTNVGTNSTNYTTSALTTNTDYRVLITQTGSNCSSTSSTFTVSVVPDPSVNITGSSSICSNTNTILTANVTGGSGAASYQWQVNVFGIWTNVGTNSVTYTTPNLLLNTNYRVIVTQTGGGCTATSSAYAITIQAGTAVTAQPSGFSICQGDDGFTLSVTAAGVGLSYQWQSSTNNTTFTNISGETGTTYTPSVSSTGTTYYRVVVTGGCGSVNSNSANVTVKTPATITAASVSPCQGGTINLTATPTPTGGTYSWSFSGGSYSSTAQNPNRNSATTAMSGTYTVNYTATNGCTAEASTAVTVGTPFIATIATNAPALGGTLQLTASGGTAYAWSGPNSFTSSLQNPTVNNVAPANSGNYYVTVTKNGCTSTASAAVSFNCSGPLLTLQNPSHFAGTWGATGSQYRFSNITTGVDGILTIVSKSHSDINIIDLDVPAASYGGYDGAFQPVIDYNYVNGGGSYDAAGQKKVTFKLDFVIAGTNTTTVLPTLNATAIDVDGNNSGEIQEFFETVEHTSYELQSPTTLTISGAIRGTGGIASQTGINETALTAMISAGYTDISGIIFSYGTVYNGNTSIIDDVNPMNSDERRLNSLQFKCYDFNTEVNCPQLNIVTSGGNTICSGGGISLTALTSGGAGSCIVQWQSSPNNTAWANVSGATGTTYNPTNITATTYYRALYSCTGAFCSPDTSNVQTATVIADPTVSLSSATPTICSGGNATIIAAVSGGEGTSSFQWQRNIAGVWTNTGSNSASFTTPTLTANADFRVIVTQSGAGCGVTSTSFTVTVVADPSVSVTGTSTICTGGNTTLTANVSGGGGTTSYQWQQNMAGTWTNVGTNSNTYNTGVLTANTDFHVVITQTGTDCANISSDFTVNVVSDPTVTISGSASICASGSTTLTAGVTDGSGAASYQWQQYIGSTWTDVGTNSANFTTPVISATTDFRVIVTQTGSNCGTTSSAYTVTIVSAPTVSITGVSTICSGGTTILTANVTGGGGSNTYQWQQNISGTWTNVGTNSSTYTTPVLTGNTDFRVVITQSGISCGVTSSAYTITTLADPSVSITATMPTICTGGSTVLMANITGGSGTITYQWQQNIASVWTNVGTNSNTYTTDVLTSNTNYRLIITQDVSGCGNTSATFTVTVVADPSVSVSSTMPTICTGGSTVLTANVTGGSGTITYQWQQNVAGVWNNVGTNSNSYTTAVLTVNTNYRLVVTQSNSDCASTSSAFTVTVVADPSVSFSGTSIICTGGSTTLTANVTGGSGTITYQWQQNIAGTWTDVGTNSANLTTAALTANTDYRVLITQTGSDCSVTSGTFSVTVLSDPSVSIAGSANICSGGTTILTANVTDGMGAATYQWQQNVSGTWTNIGTNSPTFTTPALFSDKEYRVLITQVGLGCGTTSNSFNVTVSSSISATTSVNNAIICSGGTATLSTNVTGGTGTFSYQWQSSPNGSVWTNITGETGLTYIAPNSVVGTMYYRNMITASSNGCGSVPSASTSVQVVADPSITAHPIGFIECIGGTRQLSVTATGGTTLLYQWQSSSDNATWDNIVGEINATFTPPSTGVSQMYYRVNITSSNSGCETRTSSVATVNVVIDPTVSVLVTVPTICQGGSTVLNANVSDASTSCNLQWQSSTDGVSWINISGETHSSYTTPALNATRRYKAVLNCTGNGCCN